MIIVWTKRRLNYESYPFEREIKGRFVLLHSKNGFIQKMQLNCNPPLKTNLKQNLVLFEAKAEFSSYLALSRDIHTAYPFTIM